MSNSKEVKDFFKIKKKNLHYQNPCLLCLQYILKKQNFVGFFDKKNNNIFRKYFQIKLILHFLWLCLKLILQKLFYVNLQNMFYHYKMYLQVAKTLLKNLFKKLQKWSKRKIHMDTNEWLVFISRHVRKGEL